MSGTNKSKGARNGSATREGAIMGNKKKGNLAVKFSIVAGAFGVSATSAFATALGSGNASLDTLAAIPGSVQDYLMPVLVLGTLAGLVVFYVKRWGKGKA